VPVLAGSKPSAARSARPEVDDEDEKSDDGREWNEREDAPIAGGVRLVIPVFGVGPVKCRRLEPMGWR
jgi:hypothetical protein